MTRTLSTKLITGICEKLTRGKRVRRNLPLWGRVHIDRPLPFLCVYRRPEDRAVEGTDQLLLGEASYLIASGEPSLEPSLSALVAEITATQVEAFGSFLVIELWARPEEAVSVPKDDALPRPGFRILAHEQGVPEAALFTLQNSLSKVTLRQQPAVVSVSYVAQCAPPGMRPVLTAAQAGNLHCALLGLEVDPVYRDPDTGELLPFALDTLRHKVTRALQQTFYTFAHEHTTQRPASYQELGRHAMTNAVWETDKRLAAISENFDVLLHVTPVNTPAAWRQFQSKGYGAMPEFHYRPRAAQPASLKRELYQIPLDQIEDPTLAHLFAEKRDELDRQITLYADRGTARFLYGSMQLFGIVDAELLQTANDLIEQVPDREKPGGATLDAQAFAALAQAELDYYRRRDPSLTSTVEVRDDVAGILVSSGNFLISSDVHIAQARAQATLQHEIGTHVLTHHNGRHQPFRQLYGGMAGYEALQEGLAVHAEYLAGALNPSRLRLLAGRVVAVHSVECGADFVETFRLLKDQYEFTPYTAFTVAMRVHRGGGYTKDAVYLRGLAMLLEYLGRGGDLEQLLIGKVTMGYLPLLQELRWRKVLKPGKLRPRYLDDPQSAARLQRLRDKPVLMALLED